MSNDEWVRSLTGLKKEIASFLLEGHLSDAEIAAQKRSTDGYVKKIKTELRNHGFEVNNPPNRRKSQFSAAENASVDKDLGRVPFEDIDGETANKIYADFREGLSNESVAEMYQLRAPQVIALKREWLQLVACDVLDNLYNEFGPRSADDLLYLKQQIKEASSLKLIVERLKAIGNLEERKSQLLGELTANEGENKQLIVNNRNLLNSNTELQDRHDQLEEYLDQLEQDIIPQTTEKVESLKGEVAILARKKNEIEKFIASPGTLSYVRSVVDKEAELVLINRLLLWETTLEAIIVGARRNPILSYDLFEIVCKARNFDASSKDFLGKYLWQLDQYYNELMQKISTSAVGTIVNENRGYFP